MTERSVTSGTVHPPDLTDSGRPLATSPLTVPDHVPTALRHPPTTHPPADPVARRLAELRANPFPPFSPAVSAGCSHAAALAAHCPDLFLVSAPLAARPALVADVVAAAVRGGQRVLVLGRWPEELWAAVAGRCGAAVGRAVGPHETPLRSPAAESTAHARGQRFHDALRADLSARVGDIAARVAVGDRRAKLLADRADLSAELDLVPELAAEAVEQSDALKKLIAERDAGLTAVAAHATQRAAAVQELEALKHPAGQPAGGFFKRLFGGGAKPDAAKVEAAEAKLRELDDAAPPDPHPAFDAARARLLADEATARRATLEARIAAVQADLDALPPGEDLDDLRRQHAAVQADLARLDAAHPTLPAAEMEAVRVVVGPPAAVGHDPFLSDAHPEVEPRFDRIVWADAEDLTEAEFTAVARLGAAWVLVGTPDPLHPPGYRNGRPRTALFPKLWEQLHAAVWTREGDRPLARLVAVEHRTELACEPLHGRPDVEVRFADRDGEPVLAEVVFPAHMPVCEAKAFLAREADEVRCGGYGPYEWDADATRCRWPAVEAAGGVREVIDLGNGVREEVVDGVTAAVIFGNGWTRDDAQRWLSERLTPCPRTATV